MKGTAQVELDGKISEVKEEENIVIPKGVKHRVKALNNDCVILEIAYGKFDENDIVRIEDDYQRIT
jgi:mannose-6-phosphate isomerase-like protein (cupin superfamily)